MLTGVVVMPQLVAVRPVSFRPTSYDWVPLAVVILLIVIFVWVYSGGAGPGAVCAACQSRARTRRESRTSSGIQTTSEPAVTSKAAVGDSCEATS